MIISIVFAALLLGHASSQASDHLCNGTKREEPIGLYGKIDVRSNCELSLTGMLRNISLQGIRDSSCGPEHKIIVNQKIYCYNRTSIGTIINVNNLTQLFLKTGVVEPFTIEFLTGEYLIVIISTEQVCILQLDNTMAKTGSVSWNPEGFNQCIHEGVANLSFAVEISCSAHLLGFGPFSSTHWIGLFMEDKYSCSFIQSNLGSWRTKIARSNDRSL